MKKIWKVGELAKITGLTVRTLRFYDQIGLFSPSEHSDAGHRLYNEADLSRLQQILSLKELGLTLEEIRSIVTGGHFQSAGNRVVANDSSKRNDPSATTVVIPIGICIQANASETTCNSRRFYKINRNDEKEPGKKIPGPSDDLGAPLGFTG